MLPLSDWHVSVLAGREWTGYHPDRGYRHQPEGPEGLHLVWALLSMLQPATLLEELQLERDGAQPSAWLGRPATRLIGRPSDRTAFHRPGRISFAASGADDIELIVDTERGLVGRLAARSQGRPFRVFEYTDASFDEPFEGGVFTLVPPDGEPLRPLAPSHNHGVSLAEAIA